MPNIIVNPVNQISVRVGPGSPAAVQSVATFTGPDQTANTIRLENELASNVAFLQAEIESNANSALIYTTEVYNKTNAAYALANTIANSGVDVEARALANAAFNAQNTTGIFANAAFDLANTLVTSSVDVYAREKANAAYQQANLASANANSVYAYANTIFANSNSVYTYSSTVVFPQANLAYSQANTAFNKANSANILAQSAFISSNTKLNRAGDTMQGDLLMTGNIIPTTANTYYLGSKTKPFKSLFVGPGSIDVDGIVLSNTSGALIITANTGDSIDIVGSANGSYNQANAAFDAQNTTAIFANAAFITANSGFDKANSAGVFANAAFQTANSGFDKANSAGTFANGAFVTANSGYDTANSAGIFANGAFVKANSGFNTANSSGTFANGAFVKANAAFDLANTLITSSVDSYARETANGAFLKANSSGTFANGAFVKANSGFDTANSAAIFANGAFELANTLATSSVDTYARETANASYLKANSDGIFANAAYLKANSAGNFANGAFVKANSGFDKANSAGNFANGAFETANSINIYSSSAFDTANAAFESANSAGVFANGSFDTANSSYLKANSAGNFANGAFVKANSGALFANASYLKANSDGLFANAAFIKANSGFDAANSAELFANSAFDLANTVNESVIAAFDTANSAAIFANGAFIEANSAFNVANSSNILGSSSFTKANSAGLFANSAFTRANNSLNVQTGGTITGDVTVTGNLFINGTTTSINTTVVQTTDSLIKLANNNIYSDTLDIGFYGTALTSGSTLPTYHGLARQAGSNNFLLFKGLTQDPTTNVITPGTATAANVGTLIANISGYSITSNGVDLFAYTTTAFTQANTANSSATSAGLFANSAFEKANNALALTGGTISGNVTIQQNLNVQGSVNFTGNATSYQITGNTGQFFGYTANGFNALYAGIPTGYLVQPQTVTQLTSNFDGYSGLNMQNINTGPNSSFDLFITADNGTPIEGYLDVGLGSSTYNYGDPFTIIKPNDGYFFVHGNTVTGGGNTIIGSMHNDIVFTAGGMNDEHELLRINTANNIVFKGNLISTSSANVALGNVSNVHIYGGNTGQLLTTDGSGNISFIDLPTPNTVTYTANSLIQTNGVYVSGNLWSTQVFGDYAVANGVYVLTDGTGSAPAWYIDFDFINVVKFNRVVMNINYTQSSGHTIYVQLYNNLTTAWDNIGTYTGLGSYYAFALDVIDETNYVNNLSKVQLRLYHSNQGNASHQTSIDYIALEQSYQGPQGPRGPTGATGATGATGPGVASGGTTGQVLVKNSSTNYDTAWSNNLIDSYNTANSAFLQANAAFAQANVAISDALAYSIALG